jgi:hypothetical protein
MIASLGERSGTDLSIWCERRDSNPHGFPHQILSLARLPIPPLSQLMQIFTQKPGRGNARRIG